MNSNGFAHQALLYETLHPLWTTDFKWNLELAPSIQILTWKVYGVVIIF